MLMPDSVRDSLSDLVPQFMNYINAGQLIPSVKEIRMQQGTHGRNGQDRWLSETDTAPLRSGEEIPARCAPFVLRQPVSRKPLLLPASCRAYP